MRPIMSAAGAVACAAMVAGAAAASDVAVGERMFQTQCASCHSLAPGETLAGPSLSGIGLMPPATSAAFDYSDGMRAKGGEGAVWDAATLDAFLANPRDVVPGTRHAIAVPNPELRQALVEYLMQSR